MPSRRAALIGSVACLATLVAACSSGGKSSPGNSAASAGKNSIPVMVSAGLSASGTLGRNSAMVVQAVKASAQVVNDAGGVDGHKIAVTVVDDKGDPTTAITKLQDAINSGKKPVAWFDAGPANLVAAALPVLTQNKIISFNAAPTNDSFDPTKFPYNFDLGSSAPSLAKAFCPFAKSQGHTHLAILFSDDAWGNTLGPNIKSACEAAGLTVTGVAKFDPTALDMLPQLQQLRSGNPDVLGLIAYGAPAGYVLKDLTKLGWSIPVLGDSAVAATDVLSSPPPTGLLGTPEEANLRFEVFQSTEYQDPSKQPAALNAMIKAMKALGPIPATLVLALPYDGLQLLAAALKQAGPTSDSAAIAKAIENPGGATPATGVFPKYFYTATSHNPNEPPSTFTFVKPTKVVDGQYGAPGA